MDQLMLAAFYFARPVMSVNLPFSLGGLNFFELATIGLTGMLAALALVNSLSGRRRPLSALEWWIIVFIVWCTFVAVLYHDLVVFKTYVKWVLAPATFLIIKRALRSDDDYVRCIAFALAGYSIPILASAFLQLQGKGLAAEWYLTGLKRYQGVYSDIHNMGHGVSFFLMLLSVFVVLVRERGGWLHGAAAKCFAVIMVVTCVAALYCLYGAKVRTTYVGLLVFFAVLLFLYSKRAFLVASVAGIVLAAIFSGILSALFFDVVSVTRGERDLRNAAAGRPYMWLHNLEVYAGLPLDRKIMGVGIGNKRGNREGESGTEWPEIINSHNDWLQTLLSTGPIGLFLLAGVYGALLLGALRLPGRERHAFVALICAVGAMNFASNSYISRFPLGQLFFMTMVYLEVHRAGRVATRSIPVHGAALRVARVRPRALRGDGHPSRGGIA